MYDIHGKKHIHHYTNKDLNQMGEPYLACSCQDHCLYDGKRRPQLKTAEVSSFLNISSVVMTKWEEAL